MTEPLMISRAFQLIAVATWAVLGVAGFGASLAQAQNFADQRPFSIDEIKVGALYHDMPGLWSGFSRERPAADVNVELLFRPLAYTFGGSLRPVIGGTVNVNGETSKAYADLRWELEAPSGVFFGLGIGAALHNGKLDLVDDGRKALGSQVLFHPSAEIGYRFDGANSVSLYADHVSNGYSRRHNEAMDTLGLRFGHKFSAAVANAADRADAKDDSKAADFSGFYVGAAGGYQGARADWVGGLNAAKSSPAVAGFLGYSWQSGQGVFGIEADASGPRSTLKTVCRAPNISCEVAEHGLFSIRPRFGWVIDQTMLYGTGGFAVATWENAATNLTTGRELARSGVWTYGGTVGVGVEHKFTQNLGARAEVLHYGLPGRDLSIPGIGVTSTQFQSTVGRVGLSWTFR
jgi:lipid A 3-O-deacylase